MDDALVGRGPELVVLGDFLTRSAADGGALLLTGEPAVGKTELLQAAAARAAQADTRVLQTAGSAVEMISFFWADAASYAAARLRRLPVRRSARGGVGCPRPDRWPSAAAGSDLPSGACPAEGGGAASTDLDRRGRPAVAGPVQRRRAEVRGPTCA